MRETDESETDDESNPDDDSNIDDSSDDEVIQMVAMIVKGFKKMKFHESIGDKRTPQRNSQSMMARKSSERKKERKPKLTRWISQR